MVRAWRWQEETTSLHLVAQHSVSAASKVIALTKESLFHPALQARVTGLSWSLPDPGLLLSSDDTGAVVVWDLVTNTTRSLVFGRNNIFCVAAHPEDPDLAAFGCKLGLVFIVSLRGGGKVAAWLVS